MIFRKVLSLDIETRSDVDLPKRGVYNYVNSINFCLLWVTWAYDYGERVTLDLWHNPLPEQLVEDILDPTVLKVAANATFERICFSKALGVYLPADSWSCTLVLAGRNGLPMHLDGAAAQSRVAIQKDESGKSLIRMFSIPQKETKKNEGRLWINPSDEPEKWQQYGRYNNIDVASESAVRLAIRDLPVSEFEERLYVLDQKINDRGILIDLYFVEQAIALNKIFADSLKNHIMELTGVRNANSRNQLLAWLNSEVGEEDVSFSKFDKEAVQIILGTTDSDVIRKVCEARLTLNKASITKYAAMKRYAGPDGRARGTLQYYGANRTGRWCLGEGSMIDVLDADGNVSKKPIEAVLLSDLVWDGVEWVSHEGIVCNGEKETITHDGVTGTPEHYVFISDFEKITLKEAKEKNINLWSGNTRSTK